jgi:hypothetical protein
VGFFCHNKAANPAIVGAEKLVPLFVVVPDPVDRVTDCPLQATSGLIRPSNDGPSELNET